MSYNDGVISIVIPALNEEKYLPNCLRSLKNQDYMGEYEIIVADNGSTDGTARVAQEYGARVVSCPEKKSVFYARAAGADFAHGEIIVQADADTFYPGDWLSRIASQFEKHPGVVAVTGRYIYSEPPWWAVVEYFVRRSINRITVLIWKRPVIISGATFAFRRRTFLALDGYRGITYAPDQWGIAARLSRVGKVVYDKHLCVVTSPRSVKKPLLRIVREGLVNWGRWAGYILGKPRLEAKTSPGKSPGKFVVNILLVTSLVSVLSLADGYFVPSSPVFGKIYAAGKSPDKLIALPFDDGPNEPYTSQILNILSDNNLKATFFVIGKNAQEYPDVVRDILSRGDVVANHSYSHNANHALSSYGVRDVQLAQKAIYAAAGVDRISIARLMGRSPRGKSLASGKKDWSK